MKFFITVFVLCVSVVAEELKPIMLIPGNQVLNENFSKSGKVDKKIWKPSQATRWIIKDGVLSGQQSSPEVQAKKEHHKGLEPRGASPATPREFIAYFKIRYFEGKRTKILPFIEFGHHIIRLRILEDNLDLVVDYESMQMAKSTPFKWKMGQWYECMAELKGTEFVIQIKNGPKLYAKHDILTQKAPSGQDGLGVAGCRGGYIEIDDLKLWEAKDFKKDWSQKKKDFPAYKPVKVREKPKK